jgi:ribulose-5-phosphate 4-epimerase/fuculose-1-phosphate aldolase
MLETISDIFREAYRRGWVTTRDGNASLRTADSNYFYITPKGVRKQNLQPEMFKKIELVTDLSAVPPFLRDGWQCATYTKISAELEPSGEIPMHWGLQRRISTETRVVLHFHPTYTTAAMYRGIDLQTLADEFPELSRYTSVGPTVPLIPPITQELADHCIKNIAVDKNGRVGYNIIGMDRHGVVAVDTTPWRAFEHIERLEHICKIVLAAK